MNINEFLVILNDLIYNQSVYLENKINNKIFDGLTKKLLIYVSFLIIHEFYHISYFLVILKQLFMNDNYLIGLSKYNLFLEELRTYIIFLNNRMTKIKKDMFKKIPYYFTRFNYIINEYDIIPFCYVEKTISRINQNINDEKELLRVNNLFFETKSILRKSYYYYLLYVDDLTIQNQYLKSQIIKMELARYCKISGTVLDYIIYFYMDCYKTNQKEINNYMRYMINLQLDKTSIELMKTNYIEKYNKSYIKLKMN